MSNVVALRALLVKEEGCELVAYLEKKSQKMHVGYGHLLEQEQTNDELAVLELEDELDDWTGFTITQDQADKLLNVDISDAIVSLAPAFTPEELEELDEARYIALLSMSFQLGGYGVQRFTSMVEAIQEEDWERAADEMIWRDATKKIKRSAWYTQTTDRCLAASEAMRTGSFGVTEIPAIFNTPDSELASYSNEEFFRCCETIFKELLRRITTGRIK